MLAFLKLNETDPNAHNLLFSDIPYHYCWDEGLQRKITQAKWIKYKTNTWQLVGCTLFYQWQVNATLY